MEEKKGWYASLKAGLGLAALVLTLVTGIRGIAEYVERGKTRRVQYVLDMRHLFKGNEAFQEMSDAILDEDSDLSATTHRARADYAGFLNEVAILVEADYVTPEVAYYLFSFYAIKCTERADFWVDLDLDSKPWAPLRDFVRTMRELESIIEYPADFRI